MHTVRFTQAGHYRRYRPPYPEPLFDHLRARLRLDARNSVLLDLGAGTGEIGIALAPSCARVVLVEPSEQMREEGLARQHDAGARNVTWIPRTAEEYLQEPHAAGSAAVMGRSFHWMERDLVLRRLAVILDGNGAVALIDDATPWSAEHPVQQRIGEIVRSWSINPPRPLNEPYEDAIARSPFKLAETFTTHQRREWTAQSLAGYCWSLSAMQHLSESQQTELAGEISASLAAAGCEGPLVQDAAIECLLLTLR